jgi:DNA-directed RNA polymerase subunit RPC12/RpoP
MGAGYTVYSCSSCGFGNGFYVGVGRSYKTLQDVIAKVHPKRRSTILEILDKHKIHEADFEHRIYLCEQCGDPRNVFWVRIVYDDDQIYETQFKCVRCHKTMVNLSDQIQQTKSCPLCGSGNLSCVEGLLWE